jgi:hypothetical protein
MIAKKPYMQNESSSSLDMFKIPVAFAFLAQKHFDALLNFHTAKLKSILSNSQRLTRASHNNSIVESSLRLVSVCLIKGVNITYASSPLPATTNLALLLRVIAHGILVPSHTHIGVEPWWSESILYRVCTWSGNWRSIETSPSIRIHHLGSSRPKSIHLRVESTRALSCCMLLSKHCLLILHLLRRGW